MRRTLYYVSDHQNWALEWVGHYVTEGVRARGMTVHLTEDPWKLRGQLIHFGNRYIFLNGPYQHLHPSNHVFLTWFHGQPDNPDMRPLFEQLQAALPHIDLINTSSTSGRNALMHSGVPAHQIEIIPIGVDLKAFMLPEPVSRERARNRLGVPEEALCIGLFQKDGAGWEDGNRPKLVKGPDVWLATIERLAQRYRNLFVLLTGPARGYVKNGLDKLGVPYRHDYLENYHDIVGHYHALDVYVIASRDEGGPKALMESWATGVPVVSTRMGMPADWIRHGTNGMLAEVEDAPALAEHTITVIEDMDLRMRVIRQGMEDVKQLDWQVIADQYYTKLYRPLLEN